MSEISAGTAMVRVLESWSTDHICGIPGGSFNSITNTLYREKTEINCIQVRHEEVGALAAATDAKSMRKASAVFGSTGPGATHLINGLYDAQTDHVPLVAFLGQVASASMNYNSFQELNENPIFTDVSVYNRTVVIPQSLPRVVDEATKATYERKGVAIVTIPVDLGLEEIDEQPFSIAHAHKTSVVLSGEKDLLTALPYLEKAKKPVLYVSQGTRNGFPQIKEFSEHSSVPVVTSVLAKGIIPNNYENFLGFAGRVATKLGNEALAEVDLILLVGNDLPFGRTFFDPTAEFIQIDIGASKFGRRHETSLSVLGDASTTLQRLVELGDTRPADSWYLANQKNKEKWVNWLKSFEDREEEPIHPEAIYREINHIVEDDAVLVTNVDNTTIRSICLLNMNDKQKHTTSGWFTTMGSGVPGGIAAQLSCSEKQVFILNGDNGFTMVIRGITTQVKCQLPIISVVFSNVSFGSIEAEQEDTEQKKFGVFLEDIDFDRVGEALGANNFAVTEYSQLWFAFNIAVRSNRPVTIDVKISNKCLLPVEDLHLDPRRYSEEKI